MDNGRRIDHQSLEELFGSDAMRGYVRTHEQYVPPPDPVPVAVEHRPAGVATRVNFTIKGVADFGPDAYHGPSQDRVRADIVDAITMDPAIGAVAWKPSVYYEVTEVWDYTGGPDVTQNGAPTPEGAGDETTRKLIAAIAALVGDQQRISDEIDRLARDIANERVARALEAATRRHDGPGGSGAALHDRDSAALSAVPQSRTGGAVADRQGDPGRRARAKARAARSHDDVGDADAGALGGTTTPGETRPEPGDDEHTIVDAGERGDESVGE